MLTPIRRRDPETLDDPGVDPALAERSLRDVARSNTLFGGRRAVLREVEDALRHMHAPRALLLDVGSGIGDIPAAARKAAHRRGVQLTAIGLEVTPTLARLAGRAAGSAICADALALPIADASVDIVTCSQVLHHFEDDRATALLREMSRVARARVIVADLRRNWVAMAGLWTLSFPLGFHPVSRHDGIASIRRGYTAAELRTLVFAAVGVAPDVHERVGFRLTASWTPA